LKDEEDRVHKILKRSMKYMESQSAQKGRNKKQEGETEKTAD